MASCIATVHQLVHLFVFFQPWSSIKASITRLGASDGTSFNRFNRFNFTPSDCALRFCSARTVFFCSLNIWHYISGSCELEQIDLQLSKHCVANSENWCAVLWSTLIIIFIPLNVFYCLAFLVICRNPQNALEYVCTTNQTLPTQSVELLSKGAVANLQGVVSTKDPLHLVHVPSPNKILQVSFAFSDKTDFHRNDTPHNCAEMQTLQMKW